MSDGYKEPPVSDSNDLNSIMFSREAEEYLEGVKNDLKEIEAKVDNAVDKAEAVSNMISYGGGYLSLSHVGSTFLLGSRQSNF
ncbi:MAG: hypothetical protein ACYS9V_13020, partial [Planctomycetota bacterium]